MRQATKIWKVQNGEEFSDGVNAEGSWLLQAIILHLFLGLDKIFFLIAYLNSNQ